MPNAYLDVICKRADVCPGRLFAVLQYDSGPQPANYGQLFRRAGMFAELYRHAGMKRGEIIFIILRHGLDTYAAFLGAMLQGVIPSFLPYPNPKQDPNLYWTQHRKLLSAVRPRAVLAYDELVGPLRAFVSGHGTMVFAQSEADVVQPVAGTPPMPTTEDAAVLQHSSGTTGLKKGVLLSYGAIRKQIDSYAAALEIGAHQSGTVGSWLPLYHDMGLITSFLMPLYLDMPIVSIDPFVWVSDPKLMLEAIESYHITHVWLPNFAFLHLVRTVPRKATYRLDSLRALINCSEPCKPAAFDRFLERFASCGVTAEMLQTCYAMAETVFAVSQTRVGTVPRRLTVDHGGLESLGPVGAADRTAARAILLSNGSPIAGCQVRVLLDNTFAGEDVMGEVCVRADFLFERYHENPDATETAFFDEWYRTGDLGFVHSGEIYVAGRLKDVIIVNGKNIYAHDVEACVSGISGLKPGRAAALGVYDESLGSERLLIIAERDGSGRAESVIISDVNRAVLREICIPCSDVVIVEPGWLVKTTSGKVSRSENLQKFLLSRTD